jgi:hypothetical protein
MWSSTGVDDNCHHLIMAASISRRGNRQAPDLVAFNLSEVRCLHRHSRLQVPFEFWHLDVADTLTLNPLSLPDVQWMPYHWPTTTLTMALIIGIK